MIMNSLAVYSELPALIDVDPSADLSVLQLEPGIMEALEATRPSAPYRINGTRIDFERGVITTRDMVEFPERQYFLPNRQRDREGEWAITDVSDWRRRWSVRRPTLWESVSMARMIQPRPWQAHCGDEVLMLASVPHVVEHRYPVYLWCFCDASIHGRAVWLQASLTETENEERRHVSIMPMERGGVPVRLHGDLDTTTLFVEAGKP
jgi:hypothetical protein